MHHKIKERKRKKLLKYMKKQIIFIFLFIYCASIHLLQGQSNSLFTADKELSSSMINQVYADKRGFIWVATEYGLSKYNGSKFITYKHNRKDSTSLLDNYVRTLFEDSQNNFYVGTIKGLQRYNYLTDQFTTIPILDSDHSVINAHIMSIVECSDNSLLVSTSGAGLYRYYPEQNAIFTSNSIHLPSIFINAVLETTDKSIWAATEGEGIIQLSRNNIMKRLKLGNNHEYLSITSLCQDTIGNIYAGTIEDGLFIYNSKEQKFVPVKDPNLPHVPIRSLYLNNNKELYIGTDGYGLRIYDIIKKKFKTTSLTSSLFDLHNSKIHSITKDYHNNLWLGVFQKGVLLLPHSVSNFTYWGHGSTHYNNIGENCIMAVYQDKEGSVWVGTDNDGIYVLDTQGNQKAHYTHDGSSTSVPSTIMCFYEDSNGNFWIGSFLHGMALLDKKTGKCTYVPLYDTEGNAAKRIYSITEDRNKRLWIGTLGQGLFSLDLKSRHVPNYNGNHRTVLALKDELLNLWINQLYYDPTSNHIFISSYGGLFYLDLTEMKSHYVLPDNKLGANTVINAFLIDDNRNYWIGTSNGLYLFDNKKQSLTEYTTENGLPSNNISALLKDKEGNIWISTNQGISQYNTQHQQFVSYANIQQNSELSRGAAFINNEDRIFFGGTNGVTTFTPNQIVQPNSLPNLHITDFYIHNQRVKVGMKSGSYDIIDTLKYDIPTYNLSHNDNSFTIEFAMDDFSTPTTYMYSINHGPWVNLQPGTNQISFSELNSGVYIFRIKAKDQSIESETLKIKVNIHKAWYMSNIAICIYSLIGAFILIGIFLQIRHHYKTKQKIMEHVHAEEINEAKLQFFINISHEIRTPISLILSPLKELMDIESDKEHQKRLHLINRNAQRIQQLVNQLMDIRKIEKGQMHLMFQETEIIKFTKDLAETLSYQTENKQISLQVHSDLTELNLWIDPEYFDKIVMNLLWNALKYTPQGGNINVYITKGFNKSLHGALSSYAQIIVEDSGPGINEEDMGKIFERFYQSKQHSKAGGTGIGLHLAHSLILLHHGKIYVENNKDKQGCRFIIQLPLGKKHLKNEEICNEKTAVIIPTANLEPFETQLPDKEQKSRPKNKHIILVVDDEEEIRNYLQTELSIYFNVLTCTNGKEALSIALTQEVNLIVSDVMMPEMDGITLCKKLKHNINTNNIPIILLTAKARTEDNLTGLTSGADSYLTKPFDLRILRATIENLLKSREIMKSNYTEIQDSSVESLAVNEKSPEEKLIERLMKIINENISNPDLNVEMLAEQIGMSRVHLYRKLKELTNQSTSDFIKNARLKQAAIFLTEKGMNVNETSTLVGFNHVNYFSSVFKDFYGVAPSVYVQQYKKQKTKKADIVNNGEEAEILT